MNITDELKKIKDYEKELEGQVNKSDLYQKLVDIKKEKENIKKRIDELSLYNKNELFNAVAKVISAYEKTDYFWCHGSGYGDYEFLSLEGDNQKFPLYYSPQDYHVKVDSKSQISEAEYRISQTSPLYDTLDFDTVYLKPIKEKKNMNYIEKFLNYLCQSRYNGCEDSVDTIADSFIVETRNEQELRYEEIKKKFEELTKIELREQFENSCQIDRTTIFNALSYIINEYDDKKLSAINSVSLVKTEYMHDTIMYDTIEILEEGKVKNICKGLIINRRVHDVKKYDGTFYKKLKTDSFGDPDEFDVVYNEHHCCYSFASSTGKDDTICFYDLKRELPIIEQTIYAKSFMDMIEDKFERGEKVTKDDCHDFLIEVCNQKREKQKIKIKR